MHKKKLAKLSSVLFAACFIITSVGAEEAIPLESEAIAEETSYGEEVERDDNPEAAQPENESLPDIQAESFGKISIDPESELRVGDLSKIIIDTNFYADALLFIGNYYEEIADESKLIFTLNSAADVFDNSFLSLVTVSADSEIFEVGDIYCEEGAIKIPCSFKPVSPEYILSDTENFAKMKVAIEGIPLTVAETSFIDCSAKMTIISGSQQFELKAEKSELPEEPKPEPTENPEPGITDNVEPVNESEPVNEEEGGTQDDGYEYADDASSDNRGEFEAGQEYGDAEYGDAYDNGGAGPYSEGTAEGAAGTGYTSDVEETFPEITPEQGNPDIPDSEIDTPVPAESDIDVSEMEVSVPAEEPVAPVDDSSMVIPEDPQFNTDTPEAQNAVPEEGSEPAFLELSDHDVIDDSTLISMDSDFISQGDISSVSITGLSAEFISGVKISISSDLPSSVRNVPDAEIGDLVNTQSYAPEDTGDYYTSIIEYAAEDNALEVLEDIVVDIHGEVPSEADPVVVLIAYKDLNGNYHYLDKTFYITVNENNPEEDFTGESPVSVTEQISSYNEEASDNEIQESENMDTEEPVSENANPEEIINNNEKSENETISTEPETDTVPEKPENNTDNNEAPEPAEETLNPNTVVIPENNPESSSDISSDSLDNAVTPDSVPEENTENTIKENISAEPDSMNAAVPETSSSDPAPEGENTSNEFLSMVPQSQPESTEPVSETTAESESSSETAAPVENSNAENATENTANNESETNPEISTPKNEEDQNEMVLLEDPVAGINVEKIDKGDFAEIYVSGIKTKNASAVEVYLNSDMRTSIESIPDIIGGSVLDNVSEAPSSEDDYYSSSVELLQTEEVMESVGSFVFRVYGDTEAEPSPVMAFIAFQDKNGEYVYWDKTFYLAVGSGNKDESNVSISQNIDINIQNQSEGTSVPTTQQVPSTQGTITVTPTPVPTAVPTAVPSQVVTQAPSEVRPTEKPAAPQTGDVSKTPFILIISAVILLFAAGIYMLSSHKAKK